MPKFIKRNQKSIDQSLFKNKLVFGVPLKVNFQRHGQPLPQAIIQIMKYLRKHSLATVGIFRKSGSRSRMALMREHIERTNTFDFDDIERLFSFVSSSNNSSQSPVTTTTTTTQQPATTPTTTTSSSSAASSSGVHVSTDLNSIGSGFSSQSTSKSDLVDELSTSTSAGLDLNKQIVNTELISIDLADILKQYFRELPECLFTNKLSQTLIDIFTCKSNLFFLFCLLFNSAI